jgi:protease IV
MRRPSYLKIVLKNAIVEEKSESFWSAKTQIDLLELIRLIEAATRSSTLRALVLVVKNPAIGWAQIEEIHSALDKFNQSGKTSLAYLEQADHQTLYLAAGAQEIYVPPSATIDLVGLRAELLFFRNALDYWGIQPEIFSMGEYKSAAEVFKRQGMSEASRRMSAEILTDVQERLKARIATNRRVEPGLVQEWINQGPYTARRALDAKLVDGLLYEDELDRLLNDRFPNATECPAGKLERREGYLRRLVTYRRPQIAYLVAEGIITTGESRRVRAGRPVIGADTLIALLREVRRRKRIKAVVLRLNTPGGSALASDLIWREVKITDSVKPVIVSFGNVSASGGYYIAVAGRRILGRPSTLTGSIGVLGGKFNVAGLLERLGITTDSVEKGPRSGYSSITRPFTEDEQDVIVDQMREFYEELFLRKVADGRQRTVEQVREVAEGRVWTGNQAGTRGLVDELGGIGEALESARREASIDQDRKVRVVRPARKRRWFEILPLPWLEARLPASSGPLFLMGEDLDIR